MTRLVLLFVKHLLHTLLELAFMFWVLVMGAAFVLHKGGLSVAGAMLALWLVYKVYSAALRTIMGEDQTDYGALLLPVERWLVSRLRRAQLLFFQPAQIRPIDE
ncbi:MAG: hypothetical protein SF123_07605 [Chloroflexota bacterium]|nr:hypothetical protein [Chloroflexota bacterium]